MKHYLFIVAVLPMLLLGCKRDEVVPVERNPIQLDTKAVAVEEFEWVNGEAIGIYMIEKDAVLADATIVDGHKNVKYAYVAATLVFKASSTLETIYLPENGDAVDLIAYQPHRATGTGVAAIDNYVFSVDVLSQTDQHAIDLLYSSEVKNKNKDNNTAPFKFNHMMSKVVVKLASFEHDSAALRSAVVTVSNIPTQAKFNLVNAGLSDLGVYSSVTTKLTDVAELGFEAIIVPHGARADRLITVTIGAGAPMQWIIKEGDTFAKGNYHIYLVNVGGEELDVSDQVVLPWGDGGEYKPDYDITGFFDDLKFRDYVMKEFCPAGATKIYWSDVRKVTIIDTKSATKSTVVDESISSIVGVEFFTALKELVVVQQVIEALDLGGNKNLEVVNLLIATGTTAITPQARGVDVLNVSGCHRLREVYVHLGKIQRVDFSKNVMLEAIKCYGADVSVTSPIIDVSKCIYLENLMVLGGGYEVFDISKNTELMGFVLANQKLTSLDLSNNTKLIQITCSYNKITSLDISTLTELQYINISGNPMRSIDISNCDPLVLKYLECHNTKGNMPITGNSTFTVKGAWFDNTNIPENFTGRVGWAESPATWTYTHETVDRTVNVLYEKTR